MQSQKANLALAGFLPRSAALAACAVILASGATWLVHLVAPDRSLSIVFFFAAVAFSACIGGLWSGVLATLLSALICDYFFLTPIHSFAVARGDLPIFAVFITAAILVNGVSERLRAAARAADHRFQMVSRKLVNVQEAERREIARELHDEIGQNLTALKLNLELCAKSPEGGVERLKEAIGIATDLMNRVSDLSLDLRPAMLDDLGLIPTLEWQISRFTRSTNLSVDLTQRGADRRFPSEIETTAFRIVQEALTNTVRHSGAAEASVEVNVSGGALSIEICDSGHGFDTAKSLTKAETSGLVGMIERAALVNGMVSVDSWPGKGTRVSMRLPVGSEGAA